MAQTGYTPLLTYSSSTAAAVPAAGSLTNSTLGSELAINITDGKLFYKDNTNAVQVIAWKNVPISTLAGAGTGVLTALGVNVGTAGAFVVNGGALGTPSSGTVTNLTGTASININGTVGATTPSTGAFTTLITSDNVTLGDASTDTVRVNGYMGVGGAPNSALGLYVQNTALTGTTQVGIWSAPVSTNAATSQTNAFVSQPATSAAVYTVTTVSGLRAENAILGSGSTITNQYGVFVADQTRGTNNFGVASSVSSGANKWNIYASGTADNAFAGNVRIGSAVAPTVALDVTGAVQASSNATATAFIPTGSAVPTNGMYLPAANTVAWSINSAEAMRLASGRQLLIGATTLNSLSSNLQIETPNAASNITIVRNTANASPPILYFGKSRGAAANSKTSVNSGDFLGFISFYGADGTNIIEGAYIAAAVDGTPGTNDMPGRLLFGTTADGASSSTERMRINNAGITQFNSNLVMPYQGAPTTKAAAATLTGAELITGILNTTGTTYTITLPTGTDIENALSWSANNVALDWWVINTASGTITIGANGNTTLGTLTIATGVSAHFRIRRTALNTFTVYRLS